MEFKDSDAEKKYENILKIKLTIQDKKILKPYIYLNSSPGKNIREHFIEAFNCSMKVSNEKMKRINDINLYMHQNSLLLDDIQDFSNLRRGVPAAHCIFGVGNTLNAVNYVGSILTQKVIDLDHPKAMPIYIHELMECVKGQGMELYWRDRRICPTENEYKLMVVRKTGVLFILAVKIMQLFTTASKNDGLLLAKTIGLYFQINDDYQNLTNELYFINKGFCEDISEGKFSFPIIHAVHSDPVIGEKIKDILQKRTQDLEMKKRCLSFIQQCGSFEYTKSVLRGLEKTIFEETVKLGDSNGMKSFIQNVFGISRLSLET